MSDGPSKPSTLAVQFMSEGGTLSGADMELRGAGYRLSLSKKRFATGKAAPTNATPPPKGLSDAWPKEKYAREHNPARDDFLKMSLCEDAVATK